jgi:hypothetical protein
MNTWESRKETLATLFKRLLEAGDKIPQHDAVYATDIVSDVLLLRLSNMDDLKRRNEVDDMLNRIIGSTSE